MAPGAREVSRFVEKPDRDVARELVSGGGLWNTLVMIFKTKIFLKEISRIDPLLFGFFERIWRAIGTPSVRTGLKEDVYLTLVAAPQKPGDPAVIGIIVQPLISWLWLGGLLMVIGTALAAWPGCAADRRRSQRAGRAAAPA